jgi:hypothetical protein
MKHDRHATDSPARQNTATQGAHAEAGSASAAHAEEDIRYRAYMLSVNRSSRPADPIQDWLTAEREYYAQRTENE